MKTLNDIQKKVALVKVSSSHFIHPLLEVEEQAESILGTESVYSFAIGDIEYFITAELDEPYLGYRNLFNLLIKDGNMLHQCQVSLHLWEWKYLVRGASAVNWENHFEDTSGLTDEKRYCTEQQLMEELQYWREKGEEDPDKASMVEYTRKKWVPVNLLEDGTWAPDESR